MNVPAAVGGGFELDLSLGLGLVECFRNFSKTKKKPQNLLSFHYLKFKILKFLSYVATAK